MHMTCPMMFNTWLQLKFYKQIIFVTKLFFKGFKQFNLYYKLTSLRCKIIYNKDFNIVENSPKVCETCTPMNCQKI